MNFPGYFERRGRNIFIILGASEEVGKIRGSEEVLKIVVIQKREHFMVNRLKHPQKLFFRMFTTKQYNISRLLYLTTSWAVINSSALLSL
jgi:hypothetical protein